VNDKVHLKPGLSSPSLETPGHATRPSATQVPPGRLRGPGAHRCLHRCTRTRRRRSDTSSPRRRRFGSSP